MAIRRDLISRFDCELQVFCFMCEENHAIEDAMNALNMLKREVVVWRERHAS